MKKMCSKYKGVSSKSMYYMYHFYNKSKTLKSHETKILQGLSKFPLYILINSNYQKIVGKKKKCGYF